MKERTSGNDVIKSSFDAQIAEILARMEKKAERTELITWGQSSEATLAGLQARLEDKCCSLADEQHKLALIFTSVEESIKVRIQGGGAVWVFY
jgi:hypothetical protein